MSQTRPFSFDNPSFVIRKIAEDIPALQFIREFTQNAIEAIQRREDADDYPMSVIWDRNRDFEVPEDCEESPEDLRFHSPKLCITDTGRGMTAKQMMHHLPSVGVTGGRLGSHGNFGIGGRISGIRSSPYGVVYQSWVDGVGNWAWMHSGSDTEDAGLLTLGEDARTLAPLQVIPIDDDVPMPIEIERAGGTGTRVTFLGDSIDDNTMKPPSGLYTTKQAHWIAHAVNTRYFEKPKGTKLSVRCGWSKSDASVNREVIEGQRTALEFYSELSGVEILPGLDVHWWVIREGATSSRNRLFKHPARFNINGGHVAALYQGELYDSRSEGAAFSVLRLFGITMGHRRVVLYAEPHKDSVAPDIQRTTLKMGGEPLPWDRWGRLFRENMPQGLRDYIDGLMRDSSGVRPEDIAREIRESGLLLDDKSLARRAAKDPTVSAGEESSGTGNGDQDGLGGPRPGPSPKPPSPNRPKPKIIHPKGPHDSLPSDGLDLPDTRFHWTEEGATQAGCADRPLLLDEANSLLHINMTDPYLRGFYARIVDGFVCETDDQEAVARSTFERALGCHFLGSIENLRRRMRAERWDSDRRESTLSPDGLMGLCSYMAGVQSKIVRTLSQRLNKPGAA